MDEPALKDRLNDIPDLLRANAAVVQASAVLRLERANAKQDPTIKLGVRQFQESDDVAAIVSVAIPVAFFNMNQGNIERATAQRQRSEWLARDTRLRFERELTCHADSGQLIPNIDNGQNAHSRKRQENDCTNQNLEEQIR